MFPTACIVAACASRRAIGPVDLLAGFNWAARLQTHIPGSNTPMGLYQDVACTIPATQDGDPIAAWRDELSASGSVYTQSDPQKQGLFVFVGGAPTVFLDGVDDHYIGSSASWFPSKLGTVACVYINLNTIYGTLLATITAPALQYVTATSGTPYKWYDGTSFATASLDTQGEWQRELMIRNSNTNLKRIHNGGASTDIATGNVQPSDSISAIGSTTAGNERLGGYLVGLLISPTAFTDVVAVTVDSYLASITPPSNP